MKFKIDIIIDRPADTVAQALIEPANAVQWTSDLEKFEVVERKPGETGSIAHLHYRQRGRSYIMQEVLEYAEPGRRYVSRVSGNGIIARVETTIEPINGKTRVTTFWSGTSSSIIFRLLSPLLRGMIIRRARTDLETFKTLVEAYGAHFPEKGSATETTA